MQSLKSKFQIAPKLALCLAGLTVTGLLLLAVLPVEWKALRTLVAVVQMFCVGVLVSQHLPIWVKVTGKSAVEYIPTRDGRGDKDLK